MLVVPRADTPTDTINELPNIIKIDPYNFELYRFNVGSFFETQCSINIMKSVTG